MDKYQQLYNVAKGEMGINELPGKTHNKRILAYHACTSLKAKTDEIPWCASFVNFCLKEMGEKGTNSAAARSFLKWGKSLKRPVKGCIVVLSRAGGGHVAIYHSEDKNFLYLLGGNQNNSCCIAAYKKSRLLSYRGFN